jgi:hypothetical protein
MKLEFLSAGSEDCPLVRLYDFSVDEIGSLFAQLSSLADGEETSIAIHEAPGIEIVGDCHLFLCSGPKDVGLVTLSKPAHFECIFTLATWDNIAALTEPFVQGCRGYQWLATSGDANLLLSTDGLW